MRIPQLFSSASERAAGADAAVVVGIILGVALVRDVLNLQSALAAAALGVPAWALSRFAIQLSNHARLSRRTPKNRTKLLTLVTLLAVVAAVVATTWVGIAVTSIIAANQAGWNEIIEALCLFGPLGVPAAFRLTSTNAFVRAPSPDPEAPHALPAGEEDSPQAA
jgi:hypothetical protein